MPEASYGYTIEQITQMADSAEDAVRDDARMVAYLTALQMRIGELEYQVRKLEER